jgi:hypothetical protein
LTGEKFTLLPQRVNHRSVNVLAGRCDLVRVDGQEGCPSSTCCPLGRALPNDALPGRENPRCSRRWGEIPTDSLFAGILGDEEEDEDEPDKSNADQAMILVRAAAVGRLAPLAVVLLEVDSFLAKE